MKADIHPTYYSRARVVCACGNTFITGSTKEEIHVDICSNCHPFYTGTAKYVDTEGRVERFERQSKEASGYKEVIAKKKEDKKPREDAPVPQSLKEMMELLQKD